MCCCQSSLGNRGNLRRNQLVDPKHGINGAGNGFHRRTGTVRRSFSDRSPPSATTPGIHYGQRHHPGQQQQPQQQQQQQHQQRVQFIDTMALRGKQSRLDSRTVFEDDMSTLSASSGAVKIRPKLPPPPPPTALKPMARMMAVAAASAALKMTAGNQSSQSPPDECTGSGSGSESGTPPPSAGKTADNKDNNVYEDFCFSLSSAAGGGLRRCSSDRSSGSRLTALMSTPLSTNSTVGAGVHRLEIRHPEADEPEHYQQKTSILITGDDCYSTVNVDGNSDTPIYQSSVVVNDSITSPADIRQTSTNTITISVSSPTSTLQSVGKRRALEEDLIAKNNERNSFLSAVANTGSDLPAPMVGYVGPSIIPIGGSTESATTPPSTVCRPGIVSRVGSGKTLINLDYDYEQHRRTSNADVQVPTPTVIDTEPTVELPARHDTSSNAKVPNDSNSKENGDGVFLESLLRNPVEAVKRNLVPHYCGREPTLTPPADTVVLRRLKSSEANNLQAKVHRNSFIAKLLEDPTLAQLAEGLDNDVVAKLIESSLLRLKESRNGLDMSGTKDEDDVSKLIEQSLMKVQEERHHKVDGGKKPPEQKDSKRSSISSGNSYGSATYEIMEYDHMGDLSDCYQSCSSDLTADDDTNSSRSKFYQMLVDATLSEIEIGTTNEDDHHYESIRLNGDPIYEEINDIPPPLPLSAPPIDDLDLEKRNARSIFEGASKYDILSYLVDAKERGIAHEESYAYQYGNASDIILEEEESEHITDLRHHQRQISDISSRLSHISNISDSSEDTSLSVQHQHQQHQQQLLQQQQRKSSAEIERNDSGVGSETSKTSRSKWQTPMAGIALDKISPIHLCEDCDGPVETQVTESGVMYAPLVCRKCGKKRAERKEIITEIVETEEKYGRDLQIVLEEFYQPMLVAGLLNQDQLSAIFLNVEELLENNQFLAERMRDALDIATEQGDEDLLTVNVGRIFLEATPMLHAFESYCVRQGAASLLLANLEKEKELLRIFLRVSQMENAVLRRMNLNSFLMVPVQRVTKYPLLLARLFKVTPAHLEGKDQLRQAQEKIELHLNHMNREAKDVPTKLWRRISSSSPAGRRLSCELDMINIKLRKMAVDVLEWNHEEVRFAIEGRLLFTQPNDGNWKKSRTIKLTSINALLVTNGKPSASYKADRALTEALNFPRHTGIREASLLLVREKGGRYTLLREPLFLDRCIVCSEHDWEDYFEVQEILSKESFIFKAEDGTKTKQWYAQLQYHSQGMGTWRKRRNALANIMINGMMTRT